MKRTFEFVEGGSSKFWAVEVEGARTLVSFGKIGSKGQTKVKDFADEAAALREADKLIREKLGKGYKETTAAAAPAGGPDALRLALEAALVEGPDEPANHAAYADWLQEQGDARGEYIQVQLALEDQGLKRSERLGLEKRERELFTQHGRAWLGGLAGFLLDGTLGDEFRFARGWLDTLQFPRLGVLRAGALAGAAEARLLRRLLIDSVTFEDWVGADPPGIPYDDLDYDSGAMGLLAGSAYLGNVRVLRIGEDIDPDFNDPISTHCNAEGAERFIARLPRLEELYLLAHSIRPADIFALPTLTNLRVLQVYHIDDYPFEVLADNPAVRNLTTLLCHPRSYSGYASRIQLGDLQALCESPHLKKLRHLRLRLTELGDEGCMMLAESGMLKRLKTLDLRLGSVTDEGAGVLADCPDLRNLELLNLSRNAMSADGIAQLEATGVRLIADGQHEGGDEEDDWYCVGDIE